MKNVYHRLKIRIVAVNTRIDPRQFVFASESGSCAESSAARKLVQDAWQTSLHLFWATEFSDPNQPQLAEPMLTYSLSFPRCPFRTNLPLSIEDNSSKLRYYGVGSTLDHIAKHPERHTSSPPRTALVQSERTPPPRSICCIEARGTHHWTAHRLNFVSLSWDRALS